MVVSQALNEFEIFKKVVRILTVDVMPIMCIRMKLLMVFEVI
jgi:hypothetical protein